QEEALTRARMYQVLHSASAMQAALEDRLPRGARVQVLDSDYGAFLAMARAGMRQATPHIQWFSLVFAEDSVRQEFLAALEENPPAAILLTNSHRTRTVSMPPIVGRSLRRCWHHVISSIDRKMKTALLGGST